MAIQTNRPQNRIILVVGGLLALVAGALAFVGVSKGIGGTSGPTQNVYVARADIAQGTTLAPDLFQQTTLPVSGTPADAITDVSVVAGKTAPYPLSANSVITNNFLNAQSAGGVAGQPPAAKLDITAGFVAMAIPVKGQTPDTTTELVTVGYFIQAEDHIDILIDAGGPDPASPDPSKSHSIRYAFQDVRILKVGGQAPPAATPATGQPAAAATAVVVSPPTFYVVELPRAQAELLTVLITGRGPTNVSVVKYVLRPQAEYGVGVKDPKTHVTTYPTPVYEDAPPAPNHVRDGSGTVVAGSPKDPGVSAAQITAAFPAP